MDKTLELNGRVIAFQRGQIVHVRPNLKEFEAIEVKIFAQKVGAIARMHHSSDQLFDNDAGNERALTDILDGVRIDIGKASFILLKELISEYRKSAALIHWSEHGLTAIPFVDCQRRKCLEAKALIKKVDDAVFQGAYEEVK